MAEEPVSPDETPEQRCKRLNPQLLSAASRNDTETVLRLVKEGALVTCTDLRHWSPLTWAASHGNVVLTRALLALNADRDTQDAEAGRGHTPLHWGAFKGHVEILWLLLAAGIDAETRDALGNTALHQAAAGGFLRAVETLLAWGVDVYVVNDRNHSPLVLSTDAEIKKLLRTALDTKVCASTGAQFSSSDRKFFCQVTRQFYSAAAIVKRKKYASMFAQSPEELLSVSIAVSEELDGLDAELQAATTEARADRLEQVLARAETRPVNPKYFSVAKQTLKVLKATSELQRATGKEPLESQEAYFDKIRKIAAAIAAAKAADVTVANVRLAQTEKDALELQLVFFKIFETPAHDENKMLRQLDECIEKADSNADIATHIDANLVSRAKAKTRLIRAARELHNSETRLAKVVQINSLREPLPAETGAVVDTEETLTTTIGQVKATINEATASGVENVAVATDQLKKLEILLEERKIIDEEIRQKAAKKANKGKKAKK